MSHLEVSPGCQGPSYAVHTWSLLRLIVEVYLHFCIDSNDDVHNATVRGCFDLAFETTFHALGGVGGCFAVQGEVGKEAWTFAVIKQVFQFLCNIKFSSPLGEGLWGPFCVVQEKKTYRGLKP
eukprot:14002099-Ditylum_brightwellii.AAC.1